MRNPEVPESLDGWHILHRMFRFDRPRFDRLSSKKRKDIARASRELLEPWEAAADEDVGLAQMLGHKSDLMLTHYAKDFDRLGVVQALFDKSPLAEFLTATTSYVSILELGLYGDTCSPKRRRARTRRRVSGRRFPAGGTSVFTR